MEIGVRFFVLFCFNMKGRGSGYRLVSVDQNDTNTFDGVRAVEVEGDEPAGVNPEFEDDEVGGSLGAIDLAVGPGGAELGVMVRVGMGEEVARHARHRPMAETVHRQRRAWHQLVEWYLLRLSLLRSRSPFLVCFH